MVFLRRVKMDKIITEERLKYLRLLAEKYSSAEALYTDISRLGAQLSLPMGTEHFVSDIHGLILNSLPIVSDTGCKAEIPDLSTVDTSLIDSACCHICTGL